MLSNIYETGAHTEEAVCVFQHFFQIKIAFQVPLFIHHRQPNQPFEWSSYYSRHRFSELFFHPTTIAPAHWTRRDISEGFALIYTCFNLLLFFIAPVCSRFHFLRLASPNNSRNPIFVRGSLKYFPSVVCCFVMRAKPC